MIPVLINISDIDLNGSPRVRAATNHDIVTEYSARYNQREPMPPIVVFRDHSGKLMLADGMHRVYGVAELGCNSILAEIHEGGYQEALSFALLANSRHGLPRSNDDKRQCIREAIKEWPKATSLSIAKSCDVDDHTVAAVRKEMEEAGAVQPEPVRKTSDGKSFPAKIATRKSESSPSKDAHGTVIPEGVIKFWERRDEPKQFIQTITDMMTSLRKATDAKDPMYGELSVMAVMADLEKARTALGASIPYAVCTQCQGHPEAQAGGCRLCRGRGLISKFSWDRLVPEELKAIRTKGGE